MRSDPAVILVRMTPRAISTALVVAALTSGCYFHGSVGPSFSALRGDPGHHSLGIDLHSGSFVDYVGAGPSLRLKFGERLQQISFGPTGILAIPGEVVVPYLYVGVSLAELCWIDGLFSFGALSPWGQLGMAIFLPVEDTMLYLTISGGAEYSVRWTGDPPPDNDVYASGRVGIGFFTWREPRY